MDHEGPGYPGVASPTYASPPCGCLRCLSCEIRAVRARYGARDRAGPAAKALAARTGRDLGAVLEEMRRGREEPVAAE